MRLDLRQCCAYVIVQVALIALIQPRPQNVMDEQPFTERVPLGLRPKAGDEYLRNPQLVQRQVRYVSGDKRSLRGGQAMCVRQCGMRGEQELVGGASVGERQGEKVCCLARLPTYRLHVRRDGAEQECATLCSQNLSRDGQERLVGQNIIGDHEVLNGCRHDAAILHHLHRRLKLRPSPLPSLGEGRGQGGWTVTTKL